MGLSRVSDVEQKIFMQESDASNFLKRRGKRSPKSQDEANGKDARGLLSARPSHSFRAVSWAVGTARDGGGLHLAIGYQSDDGSELGIPHFLDCRSHL